MRRILREEVAANGSSGIVGGLLYHGKPDQSYAVTLTPIHGWSCLLYTSVMRNTLWAFENYLLANKNTEKPILHILPCQIRKLAIGQFVVHRRIKGYMQYGLFRILCFTGSVTPRYYIKFRH